MRILLAIVLLFCVSMVSAVNRYPFSKDVNRAQFNYLTAQFRCLVCQDENLAASDAPLANDLRGKIYRMVKHGDSNQRIIHYMVSRYGNFVLFKPPLNKLTWVLWFAPFLLLLLSLMFIFTRVKRPDVEQAP